jgi:ABC-type multidrug transport system ATPase subunit
MITCKNLSYNYYENGKEIKLLKQVNIEVKSGYVVAVLGVNGCGKTSLLKCLSGDISEYKGEIEVEGCHFFDQLPAITEKLTGREYIDLLIALRSDVQDADLYQLIESLGIKNALDCLIPEMNDYLKQLLLLLSSVCVESKVVLLDEPFRTIDHQSGALLTTIIHKLKEQGKTVIIASNVMDTGFKLADELLIMYRGKVKQIPNHFNTIKDYHKQVLDLIMN